MNAPQWPRSFADSGFTSVFSVTSVVKNMILIYGGCLNLLKTSGQRYSQNQRHQPVWAAESFYFFSGIILGTTASIIVEQKSHHNN